MDSRAGGGRTLISPDIATCDDCLAELADPRDRRYRHPVHQLHQLRAALHHHHRSAVRPAGHDDGRLPDVSGLCGRVRRSGRSPVPRADGRLPRLWPDADVPPPGRGRRPRRATPSVRRGRCWPRAGSWPSRESAAITWPATPATRPRSARCASARTGATSRSRSWSPTRPRRLQVVDVDDRRAAADHRPPAAGGPAAQAPRSRTATRRRTWPRTPPTSA